MKPKWLGIALLLLFIINTAFQLWNYGIGEGTYFWFCNLALLIGGVALYWERKDLLILTLSPLLPTQFFWFLDHVARDLTGKDLLGLSEGLFHPGLSKVGFLLGHYHYFLLPTLLLGLVLLPNRKIRLAPGLLVLGVIVLPVCYFIFPYEQNINCAQVSCFETLPNFEGVYYFLAFTAAMLVVSLGVGQLLIHYCAPLQWDDLKLKKASKGYVAALVVGVLLTGLGFKRKDEVPHFACKAPFEDETVKVKCNFLNEHVKDWMVLHYEVTNKTKVIQECSSFIEFEGKKELFQDGLTVQPMSPLKVAILIHYPQKDTDIQLSATCRPL